MEWSARALLASLAIQCLGLVEGAWVDVTPLDDTLDSGGFANFVRYYPLTSVVTLTAEPVAEGRPFVGWQLDGVMHPFMYRSDTRLEVAIESARAARAVYRMSNVLQKSPGLFPMPSARRGSTSARP